MVHHFPPLGSRGVPPVPPTILMSADMSGFDERSLVQKTLVQSKGGIFFFAILILNFNILNCLIWFNSIFASEVEKLKFCKINLKDFTKLY